MSAQKTSKSSVQSGIAGPYRAGAEDSGEQEGERLRRSRVAFSRSPSVGRDVRHGGPPCDAAAGSALLLSLPLSTDLRDLLGPTSHACPAMPCTELTAAWPAEKASPNSLRAVIPSFGKMRYRWVLTVRCETNSR